MCAERNRLLQEYNNALLNAASATVALARVAGSAALVAYPPLLRAKEAAEASGNEMRLAHDQHVIEHGCGSKLE